MLALVSVVVLAIALFLLLRAPVKLLWAQGEDRGWSGMVLIAVGAQHPLLPDGTPGLEYARRLDRAAELYCDYPSTYLVKIMVVGSAHPGSDVPLWQAGRDYLLRQGIPGSAIVVISSPCYNCMDECRLFIREWRSRADLAAPEPILPQLILVDPAYKSLRNHVAFAWMAGWLPQMELTEENPTPKQRWEELILTIYTFFLDPDWQGQLSLMRWVTWRSRRVA